MVKSSLYRGIELEVAELYHVKQRSETVFLIDDGTL